ncbi:heme NO-binding domain-containing protein [Aeoliella mucimassa]|uniref:Heme NO binding protein n=1 Tax=Aeoliella mucimassa TaxID=2527972 RepID=A0A518AHG9_9BACT|nr:heme NO-binding domain-containing protein [Aeoliella mucimassa]QDU54167.1 Heme NO binding protein [Aeoliella mucimassa]
MKGAIFNQFLGWVDDQYGMVTTETLIDSVPLESGGAYTNVGIYDHHELLALVDELSRRTKTSSAKLLYEFGRYAFAEMLKISAKQFAKARSVFAMLSMVDQHHHAEVAKLYPDAEVPRFKTSRPADDTLELTYHSSRPFADFAEGLIKGCIDHFGESIDLIREDSESGDDTYARFRLTVHQEGAVPCNT